MDSDAVVALMSSTFRGNSSHRASELGSGGDSIPLLNRLHPQVNRRTVAILDALAELSVKNPTADVVAIGLRVRLPTVQLVVATNDQTPTAATIQHIQKIWDLLKEISAEHFARIVLREVDRHKKSSIMVSQSEKENALYCQLLREVFQYGYFKFFKRHEKYFNVLTTIEEAWKTMKKEQRGLEDNSTEKLERFVCSLRVIAKDVQGYHQDNWKVSDDDLAERFAPLLKQQLEDGKAILADKWACENWMKMVDSDLDTVVKPVGRLRRAVEKSITFHRHINTLMHFACSPKMRHMFHNTTFEIVPVNHETPLSGNWPSNEEEWERLRRDIFDRRNMHENPRDPKAEEAVITHLIEHTKRTVHCECALISYLARNPSFPAFSYIGVSKLSCKPCHLWISAYNEHASVLYRTKGCHDKWYMGWRRPLLDEKVQAKVDDAMIEKVETEYCEQEEATGKAKKKRVESVSDSSIFTDAYVYHTRKPEALAELVKARLKEFNSVD
jgi:hypothetical protein